MKDGGPAFPKGTESTGFGKRYIQSGMSLRDWFAGQFIHCLEASGGDLMLHKDGIGHRAPEEIAKGLYELADAMLAARDLPHNAGEGEAS